MGAVSLGLAAVRTVAAVGEAVADQAPARAKIAATAQDFEASFLSIMMGQMMGGLEGEAPFSGGQAEQSLRSFLTDAVGRQMAQRGGVGLAASVQREMLKLQGLTEIAA